MLVAVEVEIILAAVMLMAVQAAQVVVQVELLQALAVLVELL